MTKSSHLHALLASFEATTDAQRKFAERMRMLNASGEIAFHRHHYSPGHFTASGFVLSPDRRRLLLILHQKLGRWLQPGGHVDALDHDVIAAAQRELAEETGLTDLTMVCPGIFDVDVHIIPARGEAPAHEHFDVRFLLSSRSTRIRAASDAAAAQWVDLNEVSDVQSDASVMRAVELIRQW
jgi:8-oxo-dGTP pyrophosphatase MutT (NUDIX family)